VGVYTLIFVFSNITWGDRGPEINGSKFFFFQILPALNFIMNRTRKLYSYSQLECMQSTQIHSKHDQEQGIS